MTKKQLDFLASYKAAYSRGPKTNLYEVYGRHSYDKEKALRYCRELQSRLNGYKGTIVTHNSYVFTYAFLYYDADIKKECLCYCTPSNNYKFPVE